MKRKLNDRMELWFDTEDKKMIHNGYMDYYTATVIIKNILKECGK